MQANAVSFLDLLNGQRQYVVPRWQRRYCWGPNDIERLVEDLRTVAARPEKDLVHYGGTVLTFGRFGPFPVTQHRVIDGQQRLTTTSILLACIAEQLGPDGESNGWTARIIRETRLTNPGIPHDLTRKLRLQDRDDEEYRRGLAGKPKGSGAVTQAWKIARRLVRRCGDPGTLLDGIARLRVVHLTIDPGEDPQQIFESLNATGRPLTESEKVKNWLLIGLEEDLQRRIHRDCWLRIEKHLGAEYSSEPIDIFLRDFLRWKTGQSVGMNRTYEHFRRWAIRENREKERRALGDELTHAARLYGVLTGTARQLPHYLDKSCKREVRHLRHLGLDTHRPFSLRLLNDADKRRLGTGSLAKILKMLGIWTTRIWLADRRLNGMNTAAAPSSLTATGPNLARTLRDTGNPGCRSDRTRGSAFRTITPSARESEGARRTAGRQRKPARPCCTH